MNAPDTGRLSYGQLSVWRDIEGLPRDRWHEANGWTRWPLPDGLDVARVRRALRALGARHPSLRTTYDLTDPAAPRQVLTAGAEPEVTEREVHGDVVAEATELVGRPFDLRGEVGWRARIGTSGGRPVDVLFVKHHMAADGWCGDVLEGDFRTLLRDPEALPVAAGPLDLATWQYGPQQERSRAAGLAYWQKVAGFGPGNAFAATGTAGDGALRCAIRSHRAYTRGLELAARTRTSLSSVVLAAYTMAVAQVTGHAEVATQLMCANRFSPQWRDVVTSMNQWATAPLTAVDDLGAQAGQVHRAVLTAYRYGSYDVDTVPVFETSTGYNFITVPDVPGPPLPEDELFWDEPFSTIGHHCYLRVVEEAGAALTVRIRTKGIERERVAALMKHMHTLLTA